MDRPAVARDVNLNVLEATDTFRGRDEDAPLGFVCECGCLEPAPMTARQYRNAGGAILYRHAAAREAALGVD